MKRCILVALTLLPVPALAGDPCPIPFHIFDLGPPPWSKRPAKAQDAFWEALIFHANALPCTSVKPGAIVEGRLAIGTTPRERERLALTVLAVWKRVTKRTVADRHANP